MSDQQQLHELGDAMFWARVQHIVSAALTELAEHEPAIFAERVKYCQDTGRHGVSVCEVPGSDGMAVGFVWADRPLAAVNRTAFDPDAYFDDLEFSWVATGPDDASELDGGGLC